MFSPQDSHASRGVKQEREREKMMIETSGRKLLEQLKRFDRVGSLAKMFTACLIGTEAWFSTRSKLSWKLRGLKSSHHLYCQLAVSTLRTKETEFSLLPTPVVMDTNVNPEVIDARRERLKEKKINGNGFGQTLGEMAAKSLLPTPQARDEKNGEMGEQRSQRKVEEKWSLGLNELATAGMLPTPRESEWKGTGPIGSKSHQHRLERFYLDATMQEITGTSGQLNPRFVLEMMGFPPDWTELPFLNGGENPSKQEATQ